ncbi:MAG: MFS transporter [Oscillatoriales cyanobacterium]|nr:MAG: MFS transporter [Oscillatoriales cyanobacterium]
MLSLFRSLPAEYRRNLLCLAGAALLFWCSMASQLPVLSLYVRHVGGNDSQVGLVMGSFAIGLLLSRPQLGQMADRRGRRSVLLIGAAVAMIAPIGYTLASSIPLLMLVRVFHGLSIAAFTTGYSALVVDLSPPDRKGELIGYMTLTQPVGVAIGPALGSYLQTSFGFFPTFAMAALFGMGAVLGMTFIREQSRPPEPIATADHPRDDRFWGKLAAPHLRTPALVMLAIGLVFGTLSTFVPLLIVESRVNLIPGLFYSAAAVASFGARFLSGRQSDRLGRGSFITLSLVCYVAAMGLLSRAESVEGFVLAALLEGLGAGLLIPTMVALVSDRVPAEERGRSFSLVLLGFDLGIAISGPGLGTVSDALGYRVLFEIAAGLALVALLLFLTLSSKTIGRSIQFALGRSPDVYALAPTDPRG